MVQPTNRTALPKCLVILAAFTGFAACTTAQTVPAEGPALWTLKDDDTVVHLFGVAPVLKTDADWQRETFRAAFSEADLIVLEADSTSTEAQGAMQAAIPQLGLNQDGKTLSGTLTAEQYEEINAVSSSLGAPLQALDGLKPWLASVQLGVLSISKGDFDMTGTPMSVISGRAAEDGKRIETLEGPTHVLELMAGFPEGEQVGMLLHSARTLRDDPSQQAKLAQVWLEGDVETLGEMLHGSDGTWSSEMIYSAMLVERNAKWAERIENIMNTGEGTVFVAVGFGHLAGPDSLVRMLKDQGLKVQRQ